MNLAFLDFLLLLSKGSILVLNFTEGAGFDRYLWGFFLFALCYFTGDKLQSSYVSYWSEGNCRRGGLLIFGFGFFCFSGFSRLVIEILRWFFPFFNHFYDFEFFIRVRYCSIVMCHGNMGNMGGSLLLSQ